MHRFSAGMAPAVDVPLPIPESAWHRPTSVLVYARTRAALDLVAAAMALKVTDQPVWIEVRGPAESDGSDAATDSFMPSQFGRRFAYEPGELLPEVGLANLCVWVAGRSSDSRWVREAEDLAWLPPPLRAISQEWDEVDGQILSVVVQRAERLFLELPLGPEDISRLMEIMARRGVTLIIGTLVRPFPEMFHLFEYVVRVRAEPASPEDAPSLLLEHPPSATIS